jgi:fumarate hydratase class II
MSEFRIETDSIGEMQVPADRYWGAQTQRSLQNFKIGGERMPAPVVRALGLQKKACALANMALGNLDEKLGKAIVQAADEVIEGKLDDHFPARRLADGLGHAEQHERRTRSSRTSDRAPRRGDRQQGPVHPNDHVNRSQSSNDTFPTAMHIAAGEQVHERAAPASTHLREALDAKAKAHWATSSRSVARTCRTRRR